MSIFTQIVVAVTLKQVDNAPNDKPCSKSNYECLQYVYCAVEKCYKITPFCRYTAAPKGHKKRRSVLVTAAVISPPDCGGFPALPKCLLRSGIQLSVWAVWSLQQGRVCSNQSYFLLLRQFLLSVSRKHTVSFQKIAPTLHILGNVKAVFPSAFL